MVRARVIRPGFRGVSRGRILEHTSIVDLPGGGSPTIVDLLGARVLDAELAAELWLLLDGGVPLIVASPARSDRARWALAGLVGLAVQPIETVNLDSSGRARLRELFAAGSSPLRIAMPVAGARLEDVLERLRLSGGLTEDRIATLGVVCILSADDEQTRVVAAHYLRPPARDVGGHVQRLPPAVLATWDEAADRFEHFGWGLITELASRVGRHTGDFEAETARRAQALAGLAAAAPRDRRIIGLALEGIRSGQESGHSH